MADDPTTAGMGGAGTPRPIGGAVPRVDTQGLDSALATMARLSEQTENMTRAVVALVQHLDRVSRQTKDVEHNLDGWGMEFSTVMKNSANLQYTMERINKLQKMRVSGGTSQSGTAAYIRDLQQEYKILLQVLNTGKGQGRYVRDIKKALAELDTELKKVSRTNNQTWGDGTDHILEVNAALERTANRVSNVQRSMSKVQVKKMTEGFREMHKAMDDAFNGQWTQQLRRIPGVAGYMKANQFKRQSANAQMELRRVDSQRIAQRQEAWRAAAGTAVKQYGPKAMGSLRALGYTGGTPLGNKLATTTGRLKGTRVPGLAGPSAPTGNVAARAAGSLEQMSVKTLVVGQMVQGKNAAKELARADARAGRAARFDPKTGQPVGRGATAPTAKTRTRRGAATSVEELAERLKGNPRGKAIINGLKRKFAPAPSLEEVQGTVSGSGGFLGGKFNKLVGKLAQREGGGWLARRAQGLLSRGAGSATAGAGALAQGGMSGLLRGGLGLASRAAVPLAVVQGIIAVRDKVVEENKKIQAGLGATGIHGAPGTGTGFQAVRKSLLSTGLSNAVFMGQGLSENMSLMSTIHEDSGLAVGRTLRRGVDLGDVLSAREGSGNGFYGSIMKNSLYNGRNLGMNQDQSVRLTLKLVEKFGATMTATQEFFVGLDSTVEASGISASKYLEIIDSVTDGFSEMNKSLTHTVTILTNIGKTGRLTGDRMKSLVQDLTKDSGQSTAQRYVTAQHLVSTQGNKTIANALEAEMDTDMADLRKQLSDAGVSADLLTDVGGNAAAIDLQLQNNPNLDSETRKTITSAMNTKLQRRKTLRARKEAWDSGDPLAIASVMDNAEASAQENILMNKGLLEMIAGVAGLSRDDTKKLVAGDAGVASRVMRSPVVGQMKKSGTLASDFDIMKTANAQEQARISGAGIAVKFAQDAGNVDNLYRDGKLTAQGQTILKLQQARGITGKDDREVVQKFVDEATDPKTQGELMKTLVGLDETMVQLTMNGTAMAEALKAQTDQAAKDAAAAKSRQIVSETRTTAEIFASSFEYLFDQLLQALGSAARILNPAAWFAKRDKSTDPWRLQRRESVKQMHALVNPGALKGEDLKRFQQAEADMADVLTGSDKEVDEKSKALMAAFREFTIKSGKSTEEADRALNAQYAREKTSQVMRGGGYNGDYAMSRFGSFKGFEAATRAGGFQSSADVFIGNALTNIANEQGGGHVLGSQLQALGHWKELGRGESKDGYTQYAPTGGMEKVFDGLAEKFKDFVVKTKDSEGKTVYNVYSSEFKPKAVGDTAKTASSTKTATPVTARS